jgi:hypothetical protein
LGATSFGLTGAWHVLVLAEQDGRGPRRHYGGTASERNHRVGIEPAKGLDGRKDGRNR